MATTQNPRTQEFSRVLNISELTGDNVRQRLVATAEERAAVAGRLDLLDLSNLEADIVLRRDSVAGTYLVAGQITAVVSQACIVTLEAVENRIEADFETVYARDPAAGKDDSGDLEGSEIMDDDSIDLGEEVVQQLACAIDPYPRSLGAEVDSRWSANGNETSVSGPFAVLAKVRRDP